MKRMKGRYRLIYSISTSLIILYLLFSSLCLATDINEGKQVAIKVVDKSGNGDYTRIQEAIEKELEGATIFIKNGFYNEILFIDKKINLIGEDKNNTIINGESLQNKYSICVNALGASIEKLSIKNSGPGLYACGIKITASNTQIKDCNIYETPIGIAIFTSNNTINNCEFYDCSDEGIVLLGSSYSECKNNKIIECKFFENCDGIELQYTTDNFISNCEFYNNTHTGIDAIISSNDRNLILNCDIYNNDVHGIYLSSSSYNKIISCDILQNNNGDVVLNNKSCYNEIISNPNLGKNLLEGLISFLLNKKINAPLVKIYSIFEDQVIAYF